MPDLVQFDISRFRRRLEAMARADSVRLLSQLSRDIVENNHARSLAGLDRQGRTLTELKSPRKGRYAGATGPPLAPFGEGSGLVTNFSTRVVGSGAARAVEAGWSGIPWLIFHIEGRGHNPVRDVSGLTPSLWETARRRFADWARGLINRSL